MHLSASTLLHKFLALEQMHFFGDILDIGQTCILFGNDLCSIKIKKKYGETAPSNSAILDEFSELY